MHHNATVSDKTPQSACERFESPLPHTETRSQSGFRNENPQPGQKAGQIVRNILVASVTPYKLAKVYVGPNEWFVYFHYWSRIQGKYARQKVRVNQRGMSVAQKEKLLQEVADELNKELKVRNNRGQYHNEAQGNVKSGPSRTLVEWFKAAELDDKLKRAWKVTFRQVRTKLAEFYKYAPSFDSAGIWDLDDRFLEAYVEFMRHDHLATKTINKHLWGIEALSGWLKKKKVLESRIETKEYRVEEIKNETERYPPLTHEEKEAAFAYFETYNAGYKLMLLCQYYTCIRPAELHRLQISAFDLKRKTIYVPWMDSKNGLSAYVQILDPLLKALKAAGIEKLPTDWYLFGNKCQPSPEQFSGQYASNTWTKHRTKMNMPQEKQAYGLKHTFNIDYVEHNKYNIDWEFLRRHNRHATIQQTQQYISSLTAYFLDQTKSVILDYHKGSTKPKAKKHRQA